METNNRRDMRQPPAVFFFFCKWKIAAYCKKSWELSSFFPFFRQSTFNLPTQVRKQESQQSVEDSLKIDPRALLAFSEEPAAAANRLTSQDCTMNINLLCFAASAARLPLACYTPSFDMSYIRNRFQTSVPCHTHVRRVFIAFSVNPFHAIFFFVGVRWRCFNVLDEKRDSDGWRCSAFESCCVTLRVGCWLRVITWLWPCFFLPKTRWYNCRVRTCLFFFLSFHRFSLSSLFLSLTEDHRLLTWRWQFSGVQEFRGNF